MTVATEKFVGFTVAGADLTRVVRDMMLSEMPDGAWRTLSAAFPPVQGHILPEHRFREILDGRAKLTGVSRLKLAKDDAKRYRKELAYVYAGRFRHERRWWRPIAQVVMFGPDDARWAMTREGSAGEGAPTFMRGGMDWTSRRSAYYAAPGEMVFWIEPRQQNGLERTDQKKPVAVLFEPCGEPPFWWKPAMSAGEALASWFAAGRTLEERSATTDLDEVEESALQFKRAVEKREMDDELEEEAHQQEAARRAARLLAWKTQILAQAGNDTFELKDSTGKVWIVPNAPFVKWALSRTALKHFAPPWNTVCPSGLKLPLDDPDHSDWMLGCGASLNEDYGGLSGRSPLMEAALERAFELQETLGQYEAHVLVGGDDVDGEVGKDILVLPNLHPDHTEAFLKAKAVITERGGQLAHLAMLGRENRIPILRVPDATTRYPNGSKLFIKPAAGKIRMFR